MAIDPNAGIFPQASGTVQSQVFQRADNKSQFQIVMVKQNKDGTSSIVPWEKMSQADKKTSMLAVQKEFGSPIKEIRGSTAPIRLAEVLSNYNKSLNSLAQKTLQPRPPSTPPPNVGQGTGPVNHSFDQASQKVAYQASHGPGSTERRTNQELANAVKGHLEKGELLNAHNTLKELERRAADKTLPRDERVMLNLTCEAGRAELDVKVMQFRLPELSKWGGLRSVTVEDVLKAKAEDIQNGKIGDAPKIMELMGNALQGLIGKAHLTTGMEQEDAVRQAKEIIAKLGQLRQNGMPVDNHVSPAMVNEFIGKLGNEFLVANTNARIRALIHKEPVSGANLYEANKLKNLMKEGIAQFRAKAEAKFGGEKNFPTDVRNQLNQLIKGNRALEKSINYRLGQVDYKANDILTQSKEKTIMRGFLGGTKALQTVKREGSFNEKDIQKTVSGALSNILAKALIFKDEASIKDARKAVESLNQHPELTQAMLRNNPTLNEMVNSFSNRHMVASAPNVNFAPEPQATSRTTFPTRPAVAAAAKATPASVAESPSTPEAIYEAAGRLSASIERKMNAKGSALGTRLYEASLDIARQDQLLKKLEGYQGSYLYKIQELRAENDIKKMEVQAQLKQIKYTPEQQQLLKDVLSRRPIDANKYGGVKATAALLREGLANMMAQASLLDPSSGKNSNRQEQIAYQKRITGERAHQLIDRFDGDPGARASLMRMMVTGHPNFANMMRDFR